MASGSPSSRRTISATVAELVGGGREVGAHAAGAVEEHRDGGDVGSPGAGSPRGTRQRGEAHDGLLGQPERLAARGQHA